ncbi:MAG: hypothetical protein RIC56_15595 [Pseudomonadales bacterium]
MRDLVLWSLVVYYLATGLFISVLPLVFYETGPGVSDTGPYNMHFLRDVGFAFTVSALGIAYGLRQKLKPLLVFGTAWLAMHGLFHLVVWFMHPSIEGAVNDLILVVLPAAVATYLVLTYRNSEEKQVPQVFR